MINDMVKDAHDYAKRQGFWGKQVKKSKFPEKLALIHSEVSEALEAYRDKLMHEHYREDGKPEGFPSELADIVIRVFDLAGAAKIKDFEATICEKMTFNETREKMHGKVC